MKPSKRNGGRNSFSEVDMMSDKTILDIPVKRFDMLTDIEKRALFLISGESESKEVYLQIKERKDISFYILDENELSIINSDVWDNNKLAKEIWQVNKYIYSEIGLLKNCLRRQLQSTVYDFHFEFHLVEHCNLKCAGCTHFSSIAKEEYLDIGEFQKDITRISELTNSRARFINLLGGEPLLHPQVEAFFPIVRKAFPNTTIRIVTNGIKLLDMKDDFWKACKKNNIIIGLTQYPIDINYEYIIKKINEESVLYESFSGDDFARDEMWRLSFDETANNRPIDNFMRCPRANACVFVSHGRIYNCATIANIEHFNTCFGKEFKLSHDDYIDIYKCKSINEILSALCNPKPFCRFCNIDKRRYGVKWEHTANTPEEWI